MKWISIVMLLIVCAGCATTPKQRRIKKLKDCTLNFVGEGVRGIDSYKICKDLHKLKY